jgi:hypothetical protein
LTHQEVHSVEHGLPAHLDFNAVMEHYPAFIFGLFGERDAGASHSMHSRSFQVR